MDDEPTTTGNVVKLVLTLVIIAVVAISGLRIVRAINESVASAKSQLKGKGVDISSSGVSVKTEGRPLTAEETQDKLQSSLMKGWKSSSFEVPWVLQKGTHLGGSRHDKKKAEWEAKHGPKPHKNKVE